MKFFLQLAFISILSLAIINACNNNKSEKTMATEDSSTYNVNDNAAVDTGNTVNSMDQMKDMLARMKAVPVSGDFDIDFARIMIEHHQAAVDMSQQYVQQAKNDSLKSMAEAIINDQNQEINALKDFINSYKGSGMKHGEGELAKSISEMEGHMSMMSHTGDADKDYATNMASHLEQGIQMAKKELTNGKSGDLKKMARQMIDKLNKEISQFKIWVSEHK
jgi:uncharacterized protein (DUF305 family)